MSSSVMRIIACVLVGCAALLVGCSSNIVSRDIPSPDGRLLLRIEVNEGGGAAVPDVTSAFIIPSRTPAAHKELIFTGSAMSHFDARWSNSDQVILSIEGGYVTTCNTSVTLPPNLRVAVMGCR
jgi:hypothetical protein